ncbi:serine O-acetyltransferase [Prosthecobacter dejongeii]|uniref:Serine O-acetyltransferase n=1 Tax=Prosthecobacter dejongeii TaxID=48465 RepID=A0A7W7YPH6_9BACT|nr:serine acetyltransferase [Prosthecobacter dejongeii]MBB5039939.1 serine O-acetyltransferase [Prosthecobacter dejongeii]
MNDQDLSLAKTLGELRTLLFCDLFRQDGKGGWGHFMFHFFRNPGYRYVALFRICQFLRQSKLRKFTLYFPMLYWFQRVSTIYGVRVPLTCRIGPGFYLAHWGCIWVNPGVTVGKNLTLTQGVTLGRASRGPTSGVPTLGDNVYVGPGACVSGTVKIGNHALISANSVVLQDVPENGVVIGVPARLFSTSGSESYVTNTI